MAGAFAKLWVPIEKSPGFPNAFCEMQLGSPSSGQHAVADARRRQVHNAQPRVL